MIIEKLDNSSNEQCFNLEYCIRFLTCLRYYSYTFLLVLNGSEICDKNHDVFKS